MKDIKFYLTVKDKLRNVSFWGKLETDKNEFKLVTIKIDIPEWVKEKYNFNNNFISLEFFIGRKRISYSEISSLYDIEYEDMIEILKDDFVKLPVQQSDVHLVSTKLSKAGYDIIPMDDYLFVKSKENVTISIGNKKFKSVDIKTIVLQKFKDL